VLPPNRYDPAGFERMIKHDSNAGRPPLKAAEEKWSKEAENIIADLQKRLASAESALRSSKRKVAALQLSISSLRKEKGELKKKMRKA